MNDWKTETAGMARRLQRHGVGGGMIALVLLAGAPLTAGADGFTAAPGWWLLLAFCLVPLALAIHLQFDTLLFRVAASHDSEEAGLAAIDDLLARMGLRARPAVPASILQRFSGCCRLLLLQWLALSAGIVLYGILLLDALSGGPS
ncbi:hypothetical protein [Rhizobium sp. GR12]|uniref:hypothetical protein n=1 Tax=Rhizobium sp. GR12 TaxID=3053925 RepID=UPI002FBEF2FE